jgi:hypothetical protein
MSQQPLLSKKQLIIWVEAIFCRSSGRLSLIDYNHY